MDLVEINENILRSLCKKLKVKNSGNISEQFISKIIGKLSEKSSSDLADLFDIFIQLGIDISHIHYDKVKSEDELHVYLFLDFLNVLLEALSADNPAAFNNLLLSLNAGTSKKTSQHSTKSSKSYDFKKSSKNGHKNGGEATTTSGAEEVDRILVEARQKYGKISSLKEKLEANISFIKKVPDVSEVDNPGKVTAVFQNKSLQHKVLAKKTYHDLLSSNSTSINSSTSRSSLSSTSLKSSLQSTSSPEKSTSKKSRKMKKYADTENKEAQIVNTTDNEVHIRIPLEEASINVKVKSLDGKSLGNRRVHVRLQEEATPPPNKNKIEYGKKSVLYHHHRKSRPPMFSSKPESPPLTDKQVLETAVQIIKKRKREDNAAQKEKLSVKRQKPDPKENIDLKLQKYLRDVRTRNTNLRKIAAELND